MTKTQILLLASLSILTACGVELPRPQPTAILSAETLNIPDMNPPPVQVANAQMNEGSLFQQEPVGWSPWRDDTAHAPGDIVTVRISVNTSAEGTATTDLSRESSTDAGIDAILGCETRLPGVEANPTDPNHNTTPAHLISAKSTNSFKGDGGTKRAGKMVANVSAVVSQVYPNGNMRIHGSQNLMINNENSLLTVQGVIRATDVDVQNVVLSERIADAHIEITGRGAVSDQQRAGWLSRLFSNVWPF